MRIVSGKYKGRAINPPRNLRARPTTDFAKENLFNVLGNLVDFEECDVLDLFAGTGSISYEFASRGARSVCRSECFFGIRRGVTVHEEAFRMCNSDVAAAAAGCDRTGFGGRC